MMRDDCSGQGKNFRVSQLEAEQGSLVHGRNCNPLPRQGQIRRRREEASMRLQPPGLFVGLCGTVEDFMV